MFFEREKSMIDSGAVDIEMASNDYGSENIDNEDSGEDSSNDSNKETI